MNATTPPPASLPEVAELKEAIDNPAPQVEDVEEINPLTLIASLERDNAIQQAALRKIRNMNLSKFQGGPSNQYFGRRHEQAFDECRTVAKEALERLENYTNE